jgi:hypothetical protein
MSPSTETRENREFASEIKFLVEASVADQILDWVRGRLAPDPNGSGGSGDAYQITSIYFDTGRFDVFYRRGSFGRSKFRIRRYGTSNVVFLERKLKTGGLLTKRRSIIKLGDLERLANAEPERDWAGHWFHRRLAARGMAPVCRISYRRTARVAMTNLGPIRLTLDSNVRALSTKGLTFPGNDQHGSLLDENVVLELKYLYAMPALFKLLVEEFALNPQPMSKYRLAVDTLGLAAGSDSNVSSPSPASPLSAPDAERGSPPVTRSDCEARESRVLKNRIMWNGSYA